MTKPSDQLDYCNPGCDPELGGVPDSGCFARCGRHENLANKQDADGNYYRNQNGEWQTLKRGIGWSPVNNLTDIQLTNGEVIKAKAAKAAPQFTEAQKSMIISHARDLHLHLFVGTDEPEMLEQLPSVAVSSAIHLVDEMQRRGVL